MKKTLLAALAALALAMLLESCDTCDGSQTKSVNVFVDVTDTTNYNMLKRNYKADIENTLLPLFPMATCSGGEFRLVVLDGESGNMSKRCAYPNFEPGKTEQQIKRDPKAKAFAAKMAEAFEDTFGEEAGNRARSQVWVPLCRNLKKIAEDKDTNRKIVVIYSDLLEHSLKYSMYGPEFAKNTPAETLSALETKCKKKMPKLKDVEVYVVCHRTPGNDQLVQRSEEFWTHAFEQAGCESFSFAEELELN